MKVRRVARQPRRAGYSLGIFVLSLFSMVDAADYEHMGIAELRIC